MAALVTMLVALQALAAELLTRTAVYPTANELRKAGFGNVADSLLNAGGSTARAMAVARALEEIQAVLSVQSVVAEMDPNMLAVTARRGMGALADAAEAELERRIRGTRPDSESTTPASSGDTTLTTTSTTPDGSNSRSETSQVNRYYTCNTRADYETVLGKHGWRIWRTLCREVPCDPIKARKGVVEVRNYARKAGGVHDGQCVHRVAVNLATGEVVDGGYVSTGECAINESPERAGKVDLSTVPAGAWVPGWFKYAFGTPELELEVPDAMLGALPESL